MTKENENLIVENIGLVGNVIKSLYPTYAGNEDVFQVGCIGLIKAATSFKSDKGAIFSTYASRCIKNSISQFVCRDFAQMRRIEPEKLLSIDYVCSEKDERVTFGEYIASDNNTEEEAIDKLRLAEVKRLVKKLDTVSQDIFYLYYFQDMQQTEVAYMLGIAQKTVSVRLAKITQYIKENVC